MVDGTGPGVGQGGGRTERLQGWRKLAGTYWRAPCDPQFYGDLELDASGLQAFEARARHVTGVHVTPTHLVGKAVARALALNPDVNVRLHGNRVVRRPTADVFFIVAAEAGRELTGVKVERADIKPVVELAREVEERVSAIQVGEDPEFGRAKAMMAALPPRVLRVAMRAAAWLSTDLDLDLPALGVARQPFGGAMVSSVGMLGVERAYSPLSPHYRVPFLVLVGAIAPRPMAVGGRVVIRPMMTLTATFDHRYADGWQAARVGEAIREYCLHPAAFEPPLPAAPAAPSAPAV